MDYFVNDLDTLLKNIKDFGPDSYVMLNKKRIELDDLVLIRKDKIPFYKQDKNFSWVKDEGLFTKDGTDVFKNLGIFHGVVPQKSFTEMRGELVNRIFAITERHHQEAIIQPSKAALNSSHKLLRKLTNAESKTELIGISKLLDAFEKDVNAEIPE